MSKIDHATAFAKLREGMKAMKEYYLQEKQKVDTHELRIPKEWECAGQVWVNKPCEPCEKCSSHVNRIINSKKYTICKSCDSKLTRWKKDKKKKRKREEQQQQLAAAPSIKKEKQ